MDEEIRKAILTLLGTLPVGTEMRFYWHKGAQHMSMKYSDGSVDTARLNRAEDGTGVVVPASLH